MNLPNMITLFRLFLIPIFVLVFFSQSPNSLINSMVVFYIAGLSDVLDGYIARKYDLITKWGMMVDPLADKLMLLTVLVCLMYGGYIPFWILIIMGIKELFMVTSGIFLYKNDTVIPANYFGKASTFLFYISIFILCMDISIGTYLLYISVFSAIISLVSYFITYLKTDNKLVSKN